MFYDYLAEKTYESIMNEALEQAPDDIDKRQGSIIYDAVGPFALTAINLYVELLLYYKNTSLFTAGGECLEIACGNYGISKKTATKATRQGLFTYDDESPFNIQIGTRFSTISESSPIFYTVISKVQDGEYVLECETSGTIGNNYIGNLLPVSPIYGLGRATLADIVTPAEDDETDDTLRERCLTWLRRKPYGGNVYHYRLWAEELGGIGGVQVYPVWNGGGTVKLSIIDSEYNICTPLFISIVKEYFDPTEYTQQGLGVAPIGHNVTVVTPNEVTINVTAKVLIESGYTVMQVQNDIQSEITTYIQELRKAWANPSATNTYSVAVYRALLIARILNAKHILNVPECLINGLDADLILTESGETQQLPKIGSVVLTSAN